MGDAIFKVPTPLMLDKIVSAMDSIYADMAQLKDGDARGDVYEYLLSKLSTAGVNGQFRTPRHIIRMMVDMMQPKPDELVCEKDRQRTDQSFLVPKQEIVDNGYDLSINKYKQTEYVLVEYPPTSEILAELNRLEAEIQKELKELVGLLDE